MSARAVGALLRASWLQARSYRLALLMQMGGLLVSVIPLYFVSTALQPTMARTIAGEADQFFAFVLVGSVGLLLSTGAMSTLQGAVAGGISTGYFESLLMTRASLPSILVGLTSYGMMMTLLRVSSMIIAGSLIGASIVWSKILPALFILSLLVIAHWGIGLVGASFVIAFRTAGPLTQIVGALSAFFGGVYYPVSAIPSWLGAIAKVTPIAYGLTPLRRVLIQGESFMSVAPDVAILAAMGAGTLLVGSVSIRAALRYGKKAGTLGTY